MLHVYCYLIYVEKYEYPYDDIVLEMSQLLNTCISNLADYYECNYAPFLEWIGLPVNILAGSSRSLRRGLQRTIATLN